MKTGDPRCRIGEMLTRLYIDNFRCFVDFEYRPARKELILGRNGSGKSSLVDALLILRQIVVRGDVLDDHFLLSQRTRWLDKPQITAELEADLEGDKYVYRLVIEPWGDPPRTRIESEIIRFNNRLIYEFTLGEVRLFNDRFEQEFTYPFDWQRSCLATIIPRKENQILSRFKLWLSEVLCFRLNPFAMIARAEGESLFPNVDLSNVAAWYRHLIQAFPAQNDALRKSLRDSLDGFNHLQLDAAGENIRLLAANFSSVGSKTSKFYFGEMSDGQRCLISLYIVLHFVLARGGTVLFDEPDNFLSLREIQPWLMAVDDIVEQNQGQVLVISHHPEIINQWAPSSGVQLVRDGAGPVGVERFQGDPSSCLAASELVARGWERE